MAIEFRREKRLTSYLDPRREFQPVQVESELRWDPLTGQSGRICHFGGLRLSVPDLQALARDSLAAGCPFCPPAVEQVTPKFPEDLVPAGRIKAGEATAFPNLFPYDAHSAVVAISHAHFVPLAGFTAELLVDAWRACRAYIAAVRRTEPAAVGLVSWNYMPPAGGSQLHPHWQLVVTADVGNRHRLLWQAGRQYAAANGRPYWHDLLAEEERRGERYLGRTGNFHWLVPFVPTGVLGSVLAVHTACGQPEELPEGDAAELARGLLGVFRYLESKEVWSFNLAFFPAPPGEKDIPLLVQLVPRISMNPVLRAADANALDILYGEPFAMLYPEELCRELRPFLAG